MRCLIPDTAGIRRPGSAALDLAYVAAGRFDGFWEFTLQPWDIAAGILLVEEAGGRVADLRGAKDPLESGNIICGSPRVFQAMQERLKQVQGLEEKTNAPVPKSPWKK
jgi:myo-inositol-1(or 4)-monophosphatase